MRKARLIAPIPPERVYDSGGDGSIPKVGDIVVLDHGFTFPDGRQGGTVCCKREDGHVAWGADVYVTEIEIIEANGI
jgi:surface antigen